MKFGQFDCISFEYYNETIDNLKKCFNENICLRLSFVPKRKNMGEGFRASVRSDLKKKIKKKIRLACLYFVKKNYFENIYFVNV